MIDITPEHICNELNLNINEILNIYPYGSRVYGTNDRFSDYDFIIVYKRSLLPSGAFKDNAISSNDRMIQGTCYSRGGFIDAINNYQISALEAIFLPDDMVVQKKMNFKLNKLVEKDLAKKIISTASSSWHIAKLSYSDDDIDVSKKNIYHALRILDFGIQIKENGKIIDYSRNNDTKINIEQDENFKPKRYYNKFIELSEHLKSN